MTADPWAKYATDPAAPKPKAAPRDFRKAPWGDVATSALKRLGPSFVEDTLGTIKALPSLATRMGAGALNQRVATAAIAPLFGGPLMIDPAMTSRAINKGLGAVNDYAYERYTAPGAFKQTVATDPAGVLMDVGAVATIPEGGEGLVARAPGLAGKVARGVAKTAKVYNRVTNPVSIVGEGVAAGSKAAQRAIRGGSPLDKSGNFTDAARAAVRQAFPGGEITAAELANPKFKEALAQTFRAKGINAPAVKEAVLRYNVVSAPRAVVTKSPASGSLAAPVADAVAEGKNAIGSRIGAALDKAYRASKARAEGNYTALRSAPGSFGGTLDPALLRDEMAAELAKHGLPSTPELMERSKDAYPQAHKAMALLDDALVKGNTRLGAEITAPELMELRSQLTGLRQAADGKDIKAVGSIIDAFHSGVGRMAKAERFRTPEGLANVSFADDLEAASTAYKKHFDTFENTQGPSGLIARAVKSLRGSEAAGLGAEEAQLAAQKVLASRLTDPTEGPALRKLLANLSDDPNWQSDMRLLTAGNDTLSTKLPYGTRGPTGPEMAGRLARTAAGTGLGWGAAHLLGSPGAGELVGAVAGGALEGGIEPFIASHRLAREMSGAPATAAILDAPDVAGRGVGAAARTIPALHVLAGEQQPENPVVAKPEIREPDLSTIPGPYDEPPPEPPKAHAEHEVDPWSKYQGAPSIRPHEDDLSTAPGPFDGDRPGRASGGKVEPDTERLVQRLMALAKLAKRTSNKATKPLLKAPDAMVAKALAVAQEAI